MEMLEKILDAATELFTTYGFKSITMDDISRRAGISKKTLYLHFANKEEVVNETVVQYKSTMGNKCGGILHQADNAVEGMVKMMAFFDAWHKRINPMSLFELQRYFPEAYKNFRKMLEQLDVVLLRDNILQGQTEGLYREEVNADLMARFRLETSLLIFQPNLMVNDRNNLIDVALEIGEHFLYGIMTHKGEALYKQYKNQYLQQPKDI
jgi:TetR/AcrR family transcriptional regulator, cholesterol catabolism regulator